MLVLSRLRNESVFIGDRIQVFALDIRYDRVRLGIKAPLSTLVYRDNELLTMHSKPKGEIARDAFAVMGQLAKGQGMLVCTRKPAESIWIGDDIEISLVEIRINKARLGFEAPRIIPIHRKEVYDAIQRERKFSQKLRAASHDETDEY